MKEMDVSSINICRTVSTVPERPPLFHRRINALNSNANTWSTFRHYSMTICTECKECRCRQCKQRLFANQRNEVALVSRHGTHSSNNSTTGPNFVSLFGGSPNNLVNSAASRSCAHDGQESFHHNTSVMDKHFTF